MIEDVIFNIDLFYYLNSFAGQNIFLDYFFIFLGEYLIFIMLFFYFLFFLKIIWADKKIEFKEFLIYFSSSVGAWGITKAIKVSVPVERPFSALENVNQLLTESPLSSFPSGHATVSFAIAFSIFLYNKKIGILFLFLAFLVSLGRVFTGVHFPLDILVGSLLGIFVSLVVFKSIYYFKNMI